MRYSVIWALKRQLQKFAKVVLFPEQVSISFDIDFL